MELIVFLFACYGATNIITAGKIFESTRQAFARIPGRLGYWTGYWIKCPMCVGFMVGFAWSVIGLDIGTNLNATWQAMTAGCVSSGWCWAMRVLFARLGEDEL